MINKTYGQLIRWYNRVTFWVTINWGVESLLNQAFHNVFICSCSLTSEEVRELYWRGGAEANESTDIVFLSTKVRDRIHHSQIIVMCQPFVQTENGPLQNPSVCFYKMCSFFIVFVLSLCNNAGAVAVGQLQAPVVRALSFGQGSCPALSTRQAWRIYRAGADELRPTKARRKRMMFICQMLWF